MKTELNSLNKSKLYYYSAVTIAAACLVVFCALFLISVFRTVVHMEDPYLGEYVLSEFDNGFLNIILLTILVSASYLMYKICENIKLRAVIILMIVWTLLVGCGFVYSASRAPEGDAEIIANTAYLASQGNFTAMSDYLNEYPFNVGMAIFDEIIFRVLRFGFPDISKGYCFMALQVLNVLLMTIAFSALVMTAGLLYDSEQIQKQSCLLLMLFLPAMINCTSLSGRVPSFASSVMAMLFIVLFVKRKKLVHAALAGMFIGASLSMKMDALVFFAVFLFLIVFHLKNKKAVIGFVLFLVFSALLFITPNYLCEQRIETDLANSELSLRTTMGLDETEKGSLRYSGMYSAVSSEISRSTGSRDWQDSDSRLSAMHKQWNEPSFDSIYSNQSSRHYRESGTLYNLVCNSGKELLLEFMNIFQSFLLVGLVFSAVKLIREKDILKLLPALLLLGGLALHFVFPSDSRYAMKYYLLMVPLAAYGFGSFFDRYWTNKAVG